MCRLFKASLYVIIIVLWSSVQCEDITDCQSKLADQCFMNVHSVVYDILDLNRDVLLKNTSGLSEELCRSLNDSMNCLSSIIDETCNGSQGVARFDHWKNVFMDAVFTVCFTDRQILRDLISNIHCYNMDTFIECVENKTRLGTAQELMNTELDRETCLSLDETFTDCNGELKILAFVNDSCERSQVSAIVKVVDKLLLQLLMGSKCGEHFKDPFAPSDSPIILIPEALVLCGLILTSYGNLLRSL